MALFGKKKDDMASIGEGAPAAGMPEMGAPAEQGMPPPDYYNQQAPPDMGAPSGAPPDMQGMPPPDMGQMPEGMPPDMGASGQMPPQGMPPPDQGNFPSPQFQEPYPAGDNTKERVEEIAEAIIDEKWNELIKDINKVIEWKERTDTEIKRLAQEVDNMKERFDSLHKGVLGKITEYDQNLTTVGTEIKAMEMAFQKILPNFIENINKLDRIVKSSGVKK